MIIVANGFVKRLFFCLFSDVPGSRGCAILNGWRSLNLLNLQGIKLIGSGRAAIFGNMSPVFGILLSGVILGERLAWYHWVGFTLVLTGVVCAVSKTIPTSKMRTKAGTSEF
ncbi:EamA-like transporter family protein [Peptococcaceae bacterium CEB3]|nr:EamA-like transporter family protein [Peptococcaceae bacterium CEB3]